MLLDPKEIEIDGKKFIISKVPARAGRRIFTQYISSGMPKIGEYKLNEALMDELMTYAAIPLTGGEYLQLSTPELIDNHTTGFEQLLKLEAAMGAYNISFFQNGRLSTWLEDIAQNIPSWCARILTNSLQSLSTQNSQPCTNSEPSTP